MKELNEVLEKIFDKIIRIEEDVKSLSEEVRGCTDCKHVRIWSGHHKVIFPNDLGFTPDVIRYKVKGEIKTAEVIGGEIVGPFVKTGKVGNRANGERYGEIVFAILLDKNSHIVFEKVSGGLRKKVSDVDKDVQRMKKAANDFVIGIND